MGTLYTPLTNSPVWDWFAKPDVPQSMLGGLSNLERYTVIPVPDGPTRETLIPTALRWVGLVTYNAANDTFEYWNGTVWRPMNQALAAPAGSQAQSTLATALVELGPNNTVFTPVSGIVHTYAVPSRMTRAVATGVLVRIWSSNVNNGWTGLARVEHSISGATWTSSFWGSGTNGLSMFVPAHSPEVSPGNPPMSNFTDMVSVSGLTPGGTLALRPVLRTAAIGNQGNVRWDTSTSFQTMVHWSA